METRLLLASCLVIICGCREVASRLEERRVQVCDRVEATEGYYGAHLDILCREMERVLQAECRSGMASYSCSDRVSRDYEESIRAKRGRVIKAWRKKGVSVRDSPEIFFDDCLTILAKLGCSHANASEAKSLYDLDKTEREYEACRLSMIDDFYALSARLKERRVEVALELTMDWPGLSADEVGFVWQAVDGNPDYALARLQGIVATRLRELNSFLSAKPSERLQRFWWRSNSNTRYVFHDVLADASFGQELYSDKK